MTPQFAVPKAPESPSAPGPGSYAPPKTALRVLPTLNEDGSRRYVRPKFSEGPWLTRRRIVAYVLMVIFIGLPHLRMAGKPAVLLDLARREFTFFGTTFYPTDTVLFQVLFLGAFVSIFLFTALFGRVWCGWGCPQTVFLEHLFRPIEYLLEGGRTGTLQIDRGQAPMWRRYAKWAVYLVIAGGLAHTFLAYYVGTETLARWMTQSPREHWTPFVIMASVTGALFFNFTWFREQTCLVVCPYGRIQSVMLDRDALIVGYDAKRGEPRGKAKAAGRAAGDAGAVASTGAAPVTAPVRSDTALLLADPLALGLADAPPGARGDCIDCSACVQTCPTGIDIRDGLQMECVHCTQCIDACDSIMQKIGKPPGLIRYTSRHELEGGRTRYLRTRTVIYGTALTALTGTFTWLVLHKDSAEVTVLRGAGAPFTVDSATGRVINMVRVKIRNESGRPHAYRISLPTVPEAQLVAPVNPLPVEPGAMAETSVFVLLPPSAIRDGRRDILVRVTDGSDVTVEKPYKLVGPAAVPAAN
ncbi:MAG: 4Fe-4S binding protein [Gemmatimonadaceae bacterium]|jgi:polyferredoxin|nr:4Fe-4S binding protein [Gemmatimonadaceae bacterium]